MSWFLASLLKLMGPSTEWQTGNCAEQQEKEGFGPISCFIGLYSLLGAHCSLRPSVPSGSVNLIRNLQLQSLPASSRSSGSCQQLGMEEANENSVLLLVIPTPRHSTDVLKGAHSYRIFSKGRRKGQNK